MNYKEQARKYFSAVNNYDASTIEKMVDENYIQHNPFLATGRKPFLVFLQKLKESAAQIENIRLFEDNKHVIMQHKWKNAGAFGSDEMKAFHIIRFNNEGLIAEHWNVIEESHTALVPQSSASLCDLEKTDENKTHVETIMNALILNPKEASSLNAFDFSGIVYQKLHVVFGEANLVLAISEGRVHGVQCAIYNLFKIEDKKIVDHWVIKQKIPTENLANTNTMFGFNPLRT